VSEPVARGPRIRVLEDRVVNKIAAGEVVERPASVVKELVENSLDAGASQLAVTLRGGGRSLVRVTDDGHGMERNDAALCLERHATSKIRDEHDLFRVSSLGFRGEAIPSIAAVGRFELLTRRAEDEVGTRVKVDGGRLVKLEAAGCPPGTQISLRDIFCNVPVRRKFLRTVPTELGHCVDAVVRQAMLRPTLDVTLTHEGRVLLRAPSVADLGARAADLLGSTGEQLLPVQFCSGELEVHGLISPVGVHRSSGAGGSYLYVNGRFVRDRVVRRGVQEAYRGLVPKGRFPVVVLEVRVPPDHVDVNVHPAKTEVRFRHARDLSQSMADGIREALTRRPGPSHVPIETRYRLPGGTDHDQVGLPLGDGPSFEVVRPRARPGLAPPPVEDSSAPSHMPSERSDPSVLDRVEWSHPPTPELPQPPASPAVPRRPVELRVIGQLARTYALCEQGEDLVIIDQHLAHRAVSAHRLLASEDGGEGTALAEPVIIELGEERVAALVAHTDLLQGLGLELADFGSGSLALAGLPTGLQRAQPQALLRSVVDALPGPQAELRARAAHALASHCTIQRGQALSPYELRALLRALDELPAAARDGLAYRLSADELARRFRAP